jgi:hypothetical protein
MNQNIRFCKSADGVKLAYAVSGEGPPLVMSATWLSHSVRVCGCLKRRQAKAAKPGSATDAQDDLPVRAQSPPCFSWKISLFLGEKQGSPARRILRGGVAGDAEA